MGDSSTLQRSADLLQQAQLNQSRIQLIVHPEVWYPGIQHPLQSIGALLEVVYFTSFLSVLGWDNCHFGESLDSPSKATSTQEQTS